MSLLPPAVAVAGLLGGTFDPVHIGHLILAETARELLALDHVYFVPAGDPPHKRGAVIAQAQDRLAMLHLAIDDNPHFSISHIDLDRPGPHYSVDLVQLLQRQLGAGVELWFLMGLDSLIDLPTWHDPDRLRRLVRLAAATRPGYKVNWAPLEAVMPGLSREVTLLPMPGVSIASHNLRQKLEQGRSVRYQVPEAVRQYICGHGLYGAAVNAPPNNTGEVKPAT